MGLSTAYFSWNVQAWLDVGWLKLGSVFIDFGAQEFYADAAELRRELDSFLRKHGVAQVRIAAAVGAMARREPHSALGSAGTWQALWTAPPDATSGP